MITVTGDLGRPRVFVDREGIIDSRHDELLRYTLETLVCSIKTFERTNTMSNHHKLKIQLGNYMG